MPSADDKKAAPTPECVVIFDGKCNLCNGSVRFIMKRDHRRRFAFASAQSPEGSALAAKFGFSGPTPGSMVLVVGDHAYSKSTASLQIARRLGGLWPLLSIFLLVPRPLRDGCYSWVAVRRTKLFGTAKECVMIPPERQIAPPATLSPSPCTQGEGRGEGSSLDSPNTSPIRGDAKC